MKRTTTTTRLFTRCLGPASVAMLAFTACSSNDSAPASTVQLAPRIAVTSVKGDPRSQLLAAIFARVLEDSGYRVARKDPVELDRAGYYKAIQDGAFQLIPDATGDLLAFVLNEPGAKPAPTTIVPTEPATTMAPILITTTTAAPATTVAPPTSVGDTSVTTATPTTTTPTTTTTTPTTTTTTTTTTSPTSTSSTVALTTTSEDPAGTTTTTIAVFTNGRTVAEQVAAINASMPTSLIVTNGVAAEDKTVIACTPAAMTANAGTELITLDNLASIAPNIRIGGSAAYLADDEAGFRALLRYYGGDFKPTVTVEAADLADAIKTGKADCFGLNSMDSLITTEKLTILVDDQVMVPSNAIIALMASTVATPEAIFALDNLAGSLTTERLNQMLNQIINNGADPVVVANAFVDTL